MFAFPKDQSARLYQLRTGRIGDRGCGPIRAPLTLRLPEYIVLALETVAAEDRTTIDAYLSEEILDFAGTLVDRMEEVHPGFRRAYLYPGRE